jgi:hypothetical protein
MSMGIRRLRAVWHTVTEAVVAAYLLAADLVAVTATGVAQARRLTRLRWNVLQHPSDAQLAAKVRRGTAILRATIAALSLALLSLGTLIAT